MTVLFHILCMKYNVRFLQLLLMYEKKIKISRKCRKINSRLPSINSFSFLVPSCFLPFLNITSWYTPLSCLLRLVILTVPLFGKKRNLLSFVRATILFVIQRNNSERFFAQMNLGSCEALSIIRRFTVPPKAPKQSTSFFLALQEDSTP